MDSGNEVIIVDEKVVATTNGLNGNYEDISEMKTRSRGTQQAAPSIKSAKSGSDSESSKKDKTYSNSSVKKDSGSAANAKDGSSGASKVAVAATVLAANDKASSKKSNASAEEKTGTPTKKSKNDRDDDSGINSRASSVSNEETYSSRRLRTRSKTAEALTSSTPSSGKKGSARAPLSSYDFEDDITLEIDDSPAGSSLKRKAVLYVEEMDDESEESPQDGDEQDDKPPPAKRPSLLQRGGSLVSSAGSLLLTPLKAIRGRLTLVGSQAAVPVAAAADTTVEIVEKVEEDAEAKASGAAVTDKSNEVDKNNVDSTSGSEDNVSGSAEKRRSSVCRVM